MKHDVSKIDEENVDPNIMSKNSPPKSLSPLRLKLQEKGQKVLKKRQMLTIEQIEAKIEEARLRKDYAKAEELSRKMLEAMNRDLEKKVRAAYLVTKAEMRAKEEEARQAEAAITMKRVSARQDDIRASRETSAARSSVADIDDKSECGISE